MSDSEGETYEKQVKIVLVGDGSAGKVKSIKFFIIIYLSFRVYLRHRYRNDFLKMHLIVIIIKH